MALPYHQTQVAVIPPKQRQRLISVLVKLNIDRPLPGVAHCQRLMCCLMMWLQVTVK